MTLFHQLKVDKSDEFVFSCSEAFLRLFLGFFEAIEAADSSDASLMSYEAGIPVFKVT